MMQIKIKTPEADAAAKGVELENQVFEDDNVIGFPGLLEEFDLSHNGLAIELGRRGWDRKAKFVSSWGRWLFQQAHRWQPDDRLAHITAIRSFLQDRARELVAYAEAKALQLDAAEGTAKGDRLRAWAKDQARSIQSKTTVMAVEALARSNPCSVATPSDFDADLMLVGTPGGTLDLRTGRLRPGRPGDMITKQTAVAPAPEGTKPERWLAFLREVLADDEELIAFMQRAAGYALTGMTNEHKLLFLFGTGRNGKSTFLDVLQHIWKDYARRAPAATFLHSNNEQHPTNIAGLHGARLVVGSELPRGKHWDEAVIKDLTGGDRLSARYMRGDFFDFDPQLTLMIAGNSQPSFRGVDEAIRARVVLVPFTVTIPAERRDTALPEKLRTEAPAILRWAVDGCLEWQRRGLDVPPSLRAASDTYFDDEDMVGQFLVDCTTSEGQRLVPYGEIYSAFDHWCRRNGTQRWTQLELVKEMKQRGFVEYKSSGVRGFRGLSMKGEANVSR